MRNQERCRVLTAVAVALLLARTIPVVGREPAPIDPDANGLLGEVASAYRSLGAYSDRGVTHFEGLSKVTGEIHSFDTVEHFRFVRPNQFELRRNSIRLLCDGKRLIVSAPVRYRVKDRVEESPMETRFASLGFSSKELTQAIFKDERISFLMGDPRGGLDVETFRIILLTSDNAPRDILGWANGLKLEADRKLDGLRVRSLFLELDEGPDLRLLVHPQSKLVVRIEFEYDARAKDAYLPYVGEVKSSFWAAGAIETKPGTDWFTFVPDKHAHRVDSVSDVFIAEAENN